MSSALGEQDHRTQQLLTATQPNRQHPTPRRFAPLHAARHAAPTAGTFYDPLRSQLPSVLPPVIPPFPLHNDRYGNCFLSEITAAEGDNSSYNLKQHTPAPAPGSYSYPEHGAFAGCFMPQPQLTFNSAAAQYNASAWEIQSASFDGASGIDSTLSISATVRDLLQQLAIAEEDANSSQQRAAALRQHLAAAQRTTEHKQGELHRANAEFAALTSVGASCPSLQACTSQLQHEASAACQQVYTLRQQLVLAESEAARRTSAVELVKHQVQRQQQHEWQQRQEQERQQLKLALEMQSSQQLAVLKEQLSAKDAEIEQERFRCQLLKKELEGQQQQQQRQQRCEERSGVEVAVDGDSHAHTAGGTLASSVAASTAPTATPAAPAVVHEDANTAAAGQQQQQQQMQATSELLPVSTSSTAVSAEVTPPAIAATQEDAHKSSADVALSILSSPAAGASAYAVSDAAQQQQNSKSKDTQDVLPPAAAATAKVLSGRLVSCTDDTAPVPSADQGHTANTHNTICSKLNCNNSSVHASVPASGYGLSAVAPAAAPPTQRDNSHHGDLGGSLPSLARRSTGAGQDRPVLFLSSSVYDSSSFSSSDRWAPAPTARTSTTAAHQRVSYTSVADGRAGSSRRVSGSMSTSSSIDSFRPTTAGKVNSRGGSSSGSGGGSVSNISGGSKASTPARNSTPAVAVGSTSGINSNPTATTAAAKHGIVAGGSGGRKPYIMPCMRDSITQDAVSNGGNNSNTKANNSRAKTTTSTGNSTRLTPPAKPTPGGQAGARKAAGGVGAGATAGSGRLQASTVSAARTNTASGSSNSHQVRQADLEYIQGLSAQMGWSGSATGGAGTATGGASRKKRQPGDLAPHTAKLQQSYEGMMAEWAAVNH